MTPEEHAQARLGCLTASRAKRLLSGSYSVWNTLAREMRAPPRILGQAPPSIPSLHWGVTHEPWVRAQVWERYPQWEIEDVGYQRFHVEHPLLTAHVGASPDGIIRPMGWGYEGKAPFDPVIHERYSENWLMPEDYVPQVQFSLWVTGWPSWVFASGDPRREDERRLAVWVVRPDPALHERFTELALEFLEVFTTGEEFKTTKWSSAAQLAEMFK